MPVEDDVQRWRVRVYTLRYTLVPPLTWFVRLVARQEGNLNTAAALASAVDSRIHCRKEESLGLKLDKIDEISSPFWEVRCRCRRDRSIYLLLR